MNFSEKTPFPKDPFPEPELILQEQKSVCHTFGGYGAGLPNNPSPLIQGAGGSPHNELGRPKMCKTRQGLMSVIVRLQFCS